MYLSKKALAIFVGVGVPLAVYGGVTLTIRMKDVSDGIASTSDPRDIVAAKIRHILGFKGE
jgi:hypothetical protein